MKTEWRHFPVESECTKYTDIYFLLKQPLLMKIPSLLQRAMFCMAVIQARPESSHRVFLRIQILLNIYALPFQEFLVLFSSRWSTLTSRCICRTKQSNLSKDCSAISRDCLFLLMKALWLFRRAVSIYPATLPTSQKTRVFVITAVKTPNLAASVVLILFWQTLLFPSFCV